jgi:hypothetical protein
MADELGFNVTLVMLVINAILFVLPVSSLGTTVIADAGAFQYLPKEINILEADQNAQASVNLDLDGDSSIDPAGIVQLLFDLVGLAQTIINYGIFIFRTALFMLIGYTNVLIVAQIPLAIIFIIAVPISFLQVRYVFSVLADIGASIPRPG